MLMKISFRVGDWVFFIQFLENRKALVSQGRFSKFFRGVSFYSVLNSLCVFSCKGVFSCLAEISTHAKKCVFLAPNFFFYFKVCLFSRWVVYYTFWVSLPVCHSCFRPTFIFRCCPSVAPVTAAAIVHARHSALCLRFSRQPKHFFQPFLSRWCFLSMCL